MPTRRRISARCRLPTGQPGDRHRAGAAVEDAVEVQDEGGLARAVRAEQGDPLAAGDGQVDAEQGLVAVGVGEGQTQRGPAAPRGEAGRRTVRSRQCVIAGPVRPADVTASIRAGRRQAADGRAKAYDHWARDAVTSSMTGMEPV